MIFNSEEKNSMKIIVVGAGKVGEVLCKDLSAEGNDIVLIEKDEKILDKIISDFDVMGVLGNGATLEILREAGVKGADVFIAVTESDEINIISSIMAKKLGAKYTIARVREPGYSTDLDFMSSSLGIDLILNPDVQAATFIARNIFFPNALNVESFSNNRINLIEMSIDEDSLLCDKKIYELSKFSSAKIIICTIQRDDEIYIPNGNFILKENDKIYITGTPDEIKRFYRDLKQQAFKINSVFIVGGGRIAYFLTEMLLKKKLDIKIVELDEKKAEFLSEHYENITVINGNGVDINLLEEERFKDYDAFVSLTGIDEENILLSMYASKMGIRKTITKVSTIDIFNFLKLDDLQSIVNPKQIISNFIVKFVRAHMNQRGNNIITLYRILNNEVEAVEFKMVKDSKLLNIPLRDLKIKENNIISSIIRGNEIIFPTGNDIIRYGDHVILITKNKYIDDIDDILR